MENNNNVNVENNGTNSTGSQDNVNTNNIDYGKLEEIINKGINQKENSILKSYFSQQGLNEDQMKEAISNYKNSRKNEEDKNNKELETLTTNYNNLQKELNKEKLNNLININLMKKGLSDEQIPFILKLVETADVLNDKNEINTEKLNENIENVFKAFPNLLNKEDNKKSFVQIGTSNNNSQYEESSDALLRKAFGLKDK